MSEPATPVQPAIEALLADTAHAGHPLREALSSLWLDHQRLVRRLERITHLSDSFQSMAHESELGLTRKLERQLRHLEKVARISDRYQSMLRELNVALAHASTHDLLTGLANRRLLSERLRGELERSLRSETSLTVAMVDIDHFKHINDAYGHDIGDRVLQAIATAMQDSVREYDLCGRWGGEEFLLLLPATDRERGQGVVERVQAAVQAMAFPDLQPALKVSVSIGVASLIPGESVDGLIKRADDALMRAKRDGRDRVEYAN